MNNAARKQSLWVWATVILLLPALIYGQRTPAAAGAPGVPQSASPFGTRFAESAVPVKVHVTQYRNCFALAPANWVIYGERREGDALDIGSPDMAAASWSVNGVPGVLAMSNPQRYGSPEIALNAALSLQFRGAAITYGQPSRDEHGYTWVTYESAGAKGLVLYKAWSLAASGDPYGFVMVSRVAQTAKARWEKQGAQAIAVALSIRCTTQLRSSTGGGTGPGEEDKLESNYNQQLGMEYAHDPVTEENYWVSPATDWRNDGPEGPGYYTRSGNELRRLAPGRSD